MAITYGRYLTPRSGNNENGHGMVGTRVEILNFFFPFFFCFEWSERAIREISKREINFAFNIRYEW